MKGNSSASVTISFPANLCGQSLIREKNRILIPVTIPITFRNVDDE
ncbi:MAG TPA: hypothetical protein VEI57_00685 [Nitrospirota bacterium]|nr:hypothetical protein [Nitrospirota bacterium]